MGTHLGGEGFIHCPALGADREDAALFVRRQVDEEGQQILDFLEFGQDSCLYGVGDFSGDTIIVRDAIFC